MTARRTFSLTIAALVICFGALAASAQDWGGVYSYHANLGKTVGGTGINIDYEISIEDGSDPAAEIKADGYQTSNTVLCTTRIVGDSIQLRFLSYPDGKLENEYGVRLYEKGDLLMTLTRVAKAGKITYRAVNAKYNSEIKGPVYFKKVK